MLDATPHLGLPYIAASQAQKHVTHNEALHVLDCVVQLAVLRRDLAAPPGAPVEGDRYLVAASATGDWAGKDGDVAAYLDSAWSFMAPQAGWVCFVLDEAALIYFDGSAWMTPPAGAISTLQNLSLLGVGTTADATNPFSAKLNKALWTARSAAEGGDGDLRYTMNKETAGDTVSMLMQSGYSGRAEIGLIGDENLAFKVSADGSAWTVAAAIDRATGLLTLAGDPTAALHAATKQYVDAHAGGGRAPTDADYLVKTSSGALSAERVVTDTATVAWDWTTAGQAKANVPDGSVANAKLASVSTATIKGRTSAGTGAPEDLTPAQARSVMGLGGAATLNVGTTTGTVAAGDDSRITGAAQKASNLSDLASPASARANLAVREVLSANRTYYVRTDGSDSNTGLANSSGGAFLTIQHACDVAAGLDFSGYTVTVQIADGTYAAGAAIKGWSGGGILIVRGNNATPSNVLVSATAANTFALAYPSSGKAQLFDLKMQTATSGYCLCITGAVTVEYGNVVFGVAADAHIYVDGSGARSVAVSNYSISGGAPAHVLAVYGATAKVQAVTVTVTGSPAFTGAYIYAQNNAMLGMSATTYSGSATGMRYNVSLNSTLFLNGVTLPGSTAGATSYGGQVY